MLIPLPSAGPLSEGLELLHMFGQEINMGIFELHNDVCLEN